MSRVELCTVCADPCPIAPGNDGPERRLVSASGTAIMLAAKRSSGEQTQRNVPAPRVIRMFLEQVEGDSRRPRPPLTIAEWPKPLDGPHDKIRVCRGADWFEPSSKPIQAGGGNIDLEA